MDTNGRVAAWAIDHGAKGLVPSDPSFASTIFPNDTPAHAAAMAPTESDCALWGMAAMKGAGVAHPLLDRPYWGHTDAISDVIEIGRALGALMPIATLPQIGDLLVLTGPEHVVVVVGVTGSGSVRILTCVDGGQGAHGAGIAEVARTWNGAPPPTVRGPVLGARRIIAVVRTALMDADVGGISSPSDVLAIEAKLLLDAARTVDPGPDAA